jgi:pimeloyl-ACP methyl ester carboxylesterase
VFPARPHLDDVRALAASSEVVLVPGCGHWSPLDALAQVAAAIRRFLEASAG